MIECNYSDELLNKNLNNKKVQGNRGNTHNHMSLKNNTVYIEGKWFKN